MKVKVRDKKIIQNIISISLKGEVHNQPLHPKWNRQKISADPKEVQEGAASLSQLVSSLPAPDHSKGLGQLSQHLPQEHVAAREQDLLLPPDILKRSPSPWEFQKVFN